MERVTRDGLAYYRFTGTGWEGTRHGIFTRHGGVSRAPFASLNLGGNVGDDPKAVRQNHERMYAALGVDDAKACTVWQVHSADVVIANAPVSGRRWLAHADALMTDRAGVPLSMRFADCTPILFHDPVKGVIAIAHAGWRGTVQGIAGIVARAMANAYGCHAADLRAGIGPAIGPRKYQVGEEVVAATQSHFGTTDGLIRRDTADGTAYLDLWAANRLDLERAGIPPDQIAVAGLCTAEQVDDFFSHRQEKGKTGRFGAVIAL